MTHTLWHADDALVDRYLEGGLGAGLAASLEAHLLRCPDCRARLTARVSPAVANRVASAWPGVADRVEVPRLPLTVRAMRRLGLGGESAVLLAGARSMSTAWTIATTVVLAFAALAVFVADDAGQAVYLIVAPLIPVAGVVAAFGSATDPLTDLTRATPYPPARLVLLRSLGVAATSVPLAVVVGVLSGSSWLAFGWLLPALAFIVVVLAASTWFDPLVAGGIVGLGWAAAVASAVRVQDALLVVTGPAQIGYLALAVLAGSTLAVRIARATSPGGMA